MIDKIIFQNYKSFKEKQILELKPITILIGKNSSGKSAIAKLPTLIEGSLSRKFEEPLLVDNDGIELGAEFRDLIYGREIGSLDFVLKSKDIEFAVEIVSGMKDSELPRIRKWNFNKELKLSYDDLKKTYSNEDNNTNHYCTFSGFEISTMRNELLIEEKIPNLNDAGISLTTNYIGPFRQIPERNYTIKGTIKNIKIGNRGENAYQILISDYLYNDGKLLSRVNDWYKINFDGWGIDINANSKPDYKVELTRENPKFSVNIKDVGEGMSQALPLVVSAFMNSNEEMLTIIEQPELHLHPAAHGSLAELFATSALNSKNHYLIETHSQNFILRLRRLIAEKKFKTDNMVIYTVNYDELTNTSNLEKVIVTENGEVENWPENIFNESLDEVIQIRKAQES